MNCIKLSWILCRLINGGGVFIAFIKRRIGPELLMLEEIIEMMSEKFQNRYRVKSTRLQTWDYASEGSYFITICTKNREYYFGKIGNQKMELSNVGLIANLLWYEIKNHAKHIELGEFVVMPNHVHGVLILHENDYSGNNNGNIVETRHSVETRHALSLPENNKTIGQQRFQNQGKNTISAIIGSYKSAVTKHCNRLGFEFAWQPNFYEHIIRNEQSFQNISNYIVNNPINWKEDKFYDKE